MKKSEIKRLFGSISGNKIIGLKNIARELMATENCKTWNASRVNTAAAYRAWGLDIKDLEKRHDRLQKLGGAS